MRNHSAGHAVHETVVSLRRLPETECRSGTAVLRWLLFEIPLPRGLRRRSGRRKQARPRVDSLPSRTRIHKGFAAAPNRVRWTLGVGRTGTKARPFHMIAF